MMARRYIEGGGGEVAAAGGLGLAQYFHNHHKTSRATGSSCSRSLSSFSSSLVMMLGMERCEHK